MLVVEVLEGLAKLITVPEADDDDALFSRQLLHLLPNEYVGGGQDGVGVDVLEGEGRARRVGVSDKARRDTSQYEWKYTGKAKRCFRLARENTCAGGNLALQLPMATDRPAWHHQCAQEEKTLPVSRYEA